MFIRWLSLHGNQNRSKVVVIWRCWHWSDGVPIVISAIIEDVWVVRGGLANIVPLCCDIPGSNRKCTVRYFNQPKIFRHEISEYVPSRGGQTKAINTVLSNAKIEWGFQHLISLPHLPRFRNEIERQKWSPSHLLFALSKSDRCGTPQAPTWSRIWLRRIWTTSTWFQ